MPNLNYKYAISPTAPQRRHLSRQMLQCRLQWNRATATRKRLKGSLTCYKARPVLAAALSLTKAESNINRQNAIAAMADVFPDATPEQWPTLFELKRIFGCGPKAPLTLTLRHLDLDIVIADCEPLLRAEWTAFRAHWRLPEDDRPKKLPSRPIYFALLRAASNYAALEAKQFMDRAFLSDRSRARSSIRFDVSGNGAKSRFNKACNPSPDQRRIGNPGDPRFKRRVESFSYQEIGQALNGDHIKLKSLPVGMEHVRICLHRPIPSQAKLQRVTVTQEAQKWYAVLVLEVSDAAYRLEAQHPNKAIGLDPGATTAITSATLDFNTGEVNNKKYDWRPLEKNLAALEQISRRLSGMIGPDRRKGQRASQRWLNLNAQRSSLHAKIRNQRQDKLHKLSRHLADHSFVAIGHWEPPRKVAGRADFKHGKTEEVLPGFKGIVKVRREGRDRSIATLRQMTAEKAERTGSTILTHAAEYNTTRQCSACKELTGPQGDRSIRHWTCSQCGVAHDRDENAALNILLLALNGVEQSKAEADSVLEKPAQGTAEELYGSPSPAEAPPEEAI